MRLILASGSPRRKEIMTRLGYEYEIIKAENDEVTTKTLPADVTMELSLNKAKEVCEKIKSMENAAEYNKCIILSADTVVAVDDLILGKPASRQDAKAMIRKIAGRAHQVYTGVTIINTADNKIYNFYDVTDVYVKSLSEEEIEAYVATGESDDKAGAYAIQGIFGKYIEKYVGDFDNVVGLPAGKVNEVLRPLYKL